MQAVESPPTLVHHIATTVTERILSGDEDFRPGARLYIAKLSKMLGTSPTPIKEALRQLHEQRLVVITPRRGAVVASMSAKDFEEIFQLRAQLELVAVRLAPGRFDRSVLDDIGKVMEHMRKLVADGNVIEYQRVDLRFHALVARLSDNSRLIGFYGELAAQYRIKPAFVPMRVADMPPSWEEHAAIWKALVAGDRPGAHDHIAQHYRYAWARAVARAQFGGGEQP
ncbi:MAG: GntR family transcriptional regulator [Chloroflexi bacterium]|nr:GntR family transcriptional regulator [Chloroflexota bacterium]